MIKFENKDIIYYIKCLGGFMKKLLLVLAVLSASSVFAAGPKVPYTHEGF